MLNKTEFLIATGLSVLVLILVVVNAVLFEGNRTAQADLSTRGQYIQQSLQLEPIYQALVRSLAEMAANRSDAQIGTLLSSQGITFSVRNREGGK
jgi:hypothetical protein